MIVTMDNTTITLDSTTAFTWDQNIVTSPFGFVDLLVSSTKTSIMAVARAEGITFNRALHRNPYGTTWFQSGDGGMGPQSIRITTEVWDEAGIDTAAAELETLRGVAETATEIRTPFGQYFVAALQSFTRVPIESGYRVDMVFISSTGRQ